MPLKKFIIKIINNVFYGVKLLSGYAGLWRPAPLPVDAQVKNIMVVCLGYLGDAVFCTPCVRALKNRYPSAKVIVWAKKRSAEVFTDNPDVGELIIYDGVSIDRTRERRENFFRLSEFAKKLKERKIDLWVDLSGVCGSIFVGFSSGARYKFGFSSQGLGAFLDKEIVLPAGCHLAQRYTAVLEGAGIKVEKADYQVYTNNSAGGYIKKFLRLNAIEEHDCLISIHPSAGWPVKQWPAERFAGLIDLLAEKCKAKIMVICAEEGMPVLDKIKRQIKNKQTFFCADFSLSQLKSLLKASNLFIGHDSGPAYLAEALGVPVIAIFGPTNPVYSAPQAKNCFTIYKKLDCSAKNDMQHCHDLAAYPCKTRKCMEEITVNEVFETAAKILGGKK